MTPYTSPTQPLRTLLLSLAVLSLALFSLGCDDGTAPPDDDMSGGTCAEKSVVVDFADQVVVPTYTLLATRAAALSTAVDALVADASDSNLTTAQQAWRDMRKPWEQSEGFLFGPVDSFGYDPALDSWPLNKTDLDAVLAGSDAFSEDFVNSLSESQKGMHTIEYLLFGEGNTKSAGDFSARELEYLGAITGDVAQTADALAKSWTEGIDGNTPYRDVFATAQEPGNTAYPSCSAALQEIVNGMVGICDEVANGKIADPYDNKDVTLVESQWSFNSLSDFKDNLESIRNAYLGSVPLASTSGTGLTTVVAAANADLDTRVKAAIDDAVAKLNAIKEPFRDAISDPAEADKIEAAQASLRSLMEVLEGEVLPLVQ